MSLWESVNKDTVRKLSWSWVPALALLSLDKDVRTLQNFGLLVLFQALIVYAVDTYNWHWVNRFKKCDREAGQLPPRYPSIIPYFGNAISFVWDNANFIRRAT